MTLSCTYAALSRKLLSSGWKISRRVYQCLPQYDKTFLENEFTGANTLSYYLDRLHKLGLANRGQVLDVGCGMGQWAIALSRLSSRVFAVDVSAARLLVGIDIASQMGVDNITFLNSGAEVLPFDDNTMDVVFCYGVFMFTDMKKSLSEFYRVLKPSGSLYLNVNSFGWYLHMLIDRGLVKFNLQVFKDVVFIFVNTFMQRGTRAVVSPRRLKDMIRRAGFVEYVVAPEGYINVNNCGNEASYLKPKYPPSLYGLSAVVEVLAIK